MDNANSKQLVETATAAVEGAVSWKARGHGTKKQREFATRIVAGVVAARYAQLSLIGKDTSLDSLIAETLKPCERDARKAIDKYLSQLRNIELYGGAAGYAEMMYAGWKKHNDI